MWLPKRLTSKIVALPFLSLVNRAFTPIQSLTLIKNGCKRQAYELLKPRAQLSLHGQKKGSIDSNRSFECAKWRRHQIHRSNHSPRGIIARERRKCQKTLVFVIFLSRKPATPIPRTPVKKPPNTSFHHVFFRNCLKLSLSLIKV